MVEVSIAMFIFFVVMVAGGTFFYGGNMMADRATVRRLAVNKAIERMEWLTSLDYNQLDTQVELATAIQLDGLTAYRNTSTEAVDDSLDGYGMNDNDSNIDYKRVVVEIYWVSSDTQSVVLETIFYPDWIYVAS